MTSFVKIDFLKIFLLKRTLISKSSIPVGLDDVITCVYYNLFSSLDYKNSFAERCEKAACDAYVLRSDLSPNDSLINRLFFKNYCSILLLCLVTPRFVTVWRVGHNEQRPEVTCRSAVILGYWA